eukprot:6786128-Prymnesium_polylepis.1
MAFLCLARLKQAIAAQACHFGFRSRAVGVFRHTETTMRRAMLLLCVLLGSEAVPVKELGVASRKADAQRDRTSNELMSDRLTPRCARARAETESRARCAS